MSDTIGSEYVLAPCAGRPVTTTATSTTSTAAIDVKGAGMPGLFTFVCKFADVHVLFGNSDVAAATATNGLYIPAGAKEPFYLTDDTRYMRVIALTTVAGQCVQTYRSGP